MKCHQDLFEEVQDFHSKRRYEVYGLQVTGAGT